MKNLANLFESKVSIDKTEKYILELINAAEGDTILEDETLINVLETSKLESSEIKEKMEFL